MPKAKPPKAKPLKRRTMGLQELQVETLELIERLTIQMFRKPYEDGLNDEEFLEKVAFQLRDRINEDREFIAAKESDTTL